MYWCDEPAQARWDASVSTILDYPSHATRIDHPSILLFILDLIDFRSSPDSSAMKSDYHGRDFLDACHQNPSQRQGVDVNKGFPDSPASPSQSLLARQREREDGGLVRLRTTTRQPDNQTSAKRDAKTVFKDRTDFMRVLSSLRLPLASSPGLTSRPFRYPHPI